MKKRWLCVGQEADEKRAEAKFILCWAGRATNIAWSNWLETDMDIVDLADLNMDKISSVKLTQVYQKHHYASVKTMQKK